MSDDSAAIERALLGMAMSSPAAFDRVLDGPAVTSTSFADARHGDVWAALTALAATEGADTGPIAVATMMEKHGTLTKLPGHRAYLVEIYEDGLKVPGEIGWYVRRLLEAAEGRRLAVELIRAQQAQSAGDVDKAKQLVVELAGTLTADVGGRDSWKPIDLGPYLRGEIRRPEPSLGMARSDGLRLIYPGKEHAVIGEMESGKSWFCLACVAAEMTAGRMVVYAHFEEADPSDTVERLLVLGCPDWQIAEYFRFVAPERPVTGGTLARLLDPAPSLVIFDGVNEAMALHGWDANDTRGAAEFRQYLVKPCLIVGAATLAADHVVKDPERRGRGAIGSVHKGNGLSGALIKLENADPFGRGVRGRSHVFVEKDRPGHLRRNGVKTKVTGKTFMGELVVDDTQLNTPDLLIDFWAPKEQLSTAEHVHHVRSEDDATVLAAIETIMGKGLPANVRNVRAEAKLAKDKVDMSLSRLTIAGDVIERQGPRRARVFTVAQDRLSEVSK